MFPTENWHIKGVGLACCGIDWESTFPIPMSQEMKVPLALRRLDGMEIASVELYFHQTLTAALREEGVKVKQATEYYLVQLLCSYASTPLDPQPLGIKLVQAEQAEPLDRVKLLQEIGDTALATSGLFGESLLRRSISPSYYVRLGRTAYAQLANTPRFLSELLRDACEELAERFPILVDVLLSLRGSLNLCVPDDIIKVYERWQLTGSRFLAQRLQMSGVLLCRTPTSH